jgi:alkylation response protein AidB-like acyl-CoA dehydrogenase
MDFTFSEEQQAIDEAASSIFAGLVDPDRVAQVERTEDRVDGELWAALASADLLGLGTPEELGGIGGGMVEIGQVLVAQGQVVAPVPVHATLVEGVLPIATFGSAALAGRILPEVVSGKMMLSGALADAAASPTQMPRVTASAVEGGWRLDGMASAVPFAHVAGAIVVPARTPDGQVVVGVVSTDDETVSLDRVETTNRAIHPHVSFSGTMVTAEDVLGDASTGREVLDRMLAWAQTGLALIQVGVGSAALRQTAEHLNERTQFGRTLSSFQGTMLRAADAGIDLEAIRVTAWQAAWRLDSGLPAAEAVLIAKWQAADRGQRVVHATQHLHGGTGADIGYPIHRYFLWGKQIELELGAPSLQLSRLGALIAEHPEQVVAR